MPLDPRRRIPLGNESSSVLRFARWSLLAAKMALFLTAINTWVRAFQKVHAVRKFRNAMPGLSSRF